MTDKQYHNQKKRVQDIWDRWFSQIGMEWWQVDVQWAREREEESADTLATTNCNWQYRTACIAIHLPVCAEVNDDKLEEAIVHEFVHILVAPLQDLRDDQAHEITEHTVTTIARALIWARIAGRKEAPRVKTKRARKDAQLDPAHPRVGDPES